MFVQDNVSVSEEQRRDGLALRKAYILRSSQIVQKRQHISKQMADLQEQLLTQGKQCASNGTMQCPV